MTNFHPTIVSEKLGPTVNFYEDYFGFIATLEQDGFTLLQKQTNPGDRIAVFDTHHKCVEGRVSPVQGLILNIAVDDVKGKYDDLYMEGVDIYKEYGIDIHGRKHFVVFDPNGVLINVHENIEVPELVCQ